MPADETPFLELDLPDGPVEPDTEFRASLRRRLHVAAGRPEPATTRVGGTDMTTTSTTTAARTFQPPRRHTISPYLMVDDARAAIAWYVDVLGAELDAEPIVMDDGRVGHAELMIGDSLVMLADEFPEMDLVGPTARGGASVLLSVFLPDVDATFARAVEAGATAVEPPEDQFHGSRRGTVLDPFGHRWMLSTWLGTGDEQAVDDASLSTDSSTGSSTHAQDLWNEVGYYVLGIRDLDRAVTFYGGVFGWRFSDEGVSPWGERNRHVENARVPFGISEGDRPFVTPYFRVADLDAAVGRVVELGGQVVERHDYESGPDATCLDDQGTRFELWQPRPGY